MFRVRNIGTARGSPATRLRRTYVRLRTLRLDCQKCFTRESNRSLPLRVGDYLTGNRFVWRKPVCWPHSSIIRQRPGVQHVYVCDRAFA